jgi:uncharacterized protein YbaP (TraB family)
LKKLLLLLLLALSAANAQEKKYQSLLWEVSGNGLAKKSYLYGSMHVSEKVSYHLSDSFFTHLLASDFVANESEPSSWIQIYDVLNMKQDYASAANGGFYSRFYQQPIKREQLYPLFVSNNYTLNSILFRTSENEKDYQEDTYLDMFIHQTGKKYKKKTVGLEDAKTSMISIMNAEGGEMKPKEENVQAIMKLLKEKSFNQALLDYYREKDLDMIDSIYSLIAPETYLKAMLYDRNIIMTKSIDSIARKGSLFAAIGAAHLPGKNGVIELLRQKGYTVSPVTDAYTQKGKNIKKEIDIYFIKPVFEYKTTADGMVRLPMNNQLIYNGEDIGTPDLANGGIINLKRILLRDYLRKDNRVFSPMTIDSLFYENIPGEIIDKKFFKEDNYTGYDIRNKTKTGNAQHYRYFITPLEIITVSMSGNGDYVRHYENEIFNNINIRKSTAEWETISPQKGGFSVLTPAYYTLYGNRNSSNPEDIELNAYDQTDKSYYFVTERTLDDNDNLEETDFEIKRIQEEFYTQHDIEPSTVTGKRTESGYESNSKIGNKNISLKTILHGTKYYLLGTVQARPENTKRFFDSFTLKPFRYETRTRTFVDSSAYFAISVPEKQNEKLFWKSSIKKKGWDKEKKENSFTGKSNTYTFTSASGKIVDLRFSQYHRYASEINIDSVWADYKKAIRNDYSQSDYDEEYYDEYDSEERATTLANPVLYSKKGFAKSTWDKELESSDEQQKKRKVELVDEKQFYNKEQDFHQIEVLATTPQSDQAIKYKAIFKDGYTYEFQALVPKSYKNDDSFIEQTFASFKPFSPKNEHSVFENKIALFIRDAQSSHDSIRFSAMNSVYMIQPRKEDLAALKQFVSTYSFRADEIETQTTLIEKIGLVNDPQVIPFLASQYTKEISNTIMQFAVLRALANQKSRPAYKKILELLEFDLPLSDNEYEIEGLFAYFEEDIENSQVLFPDIFQFYSIKEYHNPIIKFANKLFEEGLVNPNKLNSYKKMLLTNAKLEYKRVASWKAKDNARAEEEDYSFEVAPTQDLLNYINLTFPFRKDKEVAAYFSKIRQLDIDELHMELARLELVNNHSVREELQQKLLDNPKTRFITYQMLSNAKKLPANHLDDQTIAEAGIIHFEQADTKKDSVSLLEKRVVPYGAKSITYYFYKISPRKFENNYNVYGNGEKRLVAIAFVNENGKIIPTAYKSLAGKLIVDEDDLEMQYDAIIDQSLNSKRIRASFGKQDNSYLMNMMNGY